MLTVAYSSKHSCLSTISLIALFECHFFCFVLDCTVPFLLQHHGYLTVVPDPFHAVADQVGQRPREPYGKVPLVCRPLPLPVLLGFPCVGIWPVSGWLAGPGWRWRPPNYVDCLRDRCQRDAVSMPPLPTQVPPQLGLFAPAPALYGPMGHCGDNNLRLLWQTLLLLLQMLQVLQQG